MIKSKLYIVKGFMKNFFCTLVLCGSLLLTPSFSKTKVADNLNLFGGEKLSSVSTWVGLTGLLVSLFWCGQLGEEVYLFSEDEIARLKAERLARDAKLSARLYPPRNEGLWGQPTKGGPVFRAYGREQKDKMIENQKWASGGIALSAAVLAFGAITHCWSVTAKLQGDPESA